MYLTTWAKTSENKLDVLEKFKQNNNQIEKFKQNNNQIEKFKQNNNLEKNS